MKKIKSIHYLLLVTPLYFLTRLINLLNIPIFTDEAIYSYWAQVALHDPVNRFISLEDGKQPLFIWLAAFSQKFVPDPLLASRLVSVFSGYGSVIGIYFLAKELFGQSEAKISVLLYIILPFTLLYDRLALFDSLLTMFCIYAVLFTVKMAKNPKLDLAMLNGFTIGLGLITKSSAVFFIYLLPLSALIWIRDKNNILKKPIKWAGLTILTVIISQTIYNSLRVSPLFYLIDRKNYQFIRTFSEVVANPLQHFSSNLNSMLTWLFQYTGPLIIIILFVIFLGFIKGQKKIIFLSLYIMAPLLGEAIFNKVLYPRFSLFFYPFIIILLAFGINYFVRYSRQNRSLAKIFVAILIIYPLISSIAIITNPPISKIATADKNQFINDWPSGFGVREIVDILEKETLNQKVVVGTEGTFGLLPFALQIYFYGNPNIQIIGFWPVGEIPAQIHQTAKVNKTYFVFNENQKPNPVDDKNLKLIGRYQKGTGKTYMRLYEVTTE